MAHIEVIFPSPGCRVSGVRSGVLVEAVGASPSQELPATTPNSGSMGGVWDPGRCERRFRGILRQKPFAGS